MPATPATPTEPGAWCAGIDVGKDNLDVAFAPATPGHAGAGQAPQAFRVANDPAGHAAALDRIRAAGVRLAVLEASGGYESAVLHALLDASVPVARAKPASVRAFAHAAGVLAKTDAIDAALIARFAAAVAPPPLAKPDEATRLRDDLVSRRRQLLQIRSAELCRLKQARRDAVAHSVQAVIDALDLQLADIERQIDESLDQDPRVAELVLRLDAVQGVGPVTCRTLVAQLPELGALDRAAVASLVGVAPFNRDSGAKKGQRFIRGGRAEVRSVLYMAALAATRHNNVIRAHYQSLVKRGKLPKVALIACVRKLLLHLNSIARRFLAEHPKTATTP